MWYNFKGHIMEIKFFNKNWNSKFDFDKWLSDHQPKKRFNVNFWDDILMEHEDVVDEFKKLLEAKENVTDTEGNILTPLDLYNLINGYLIRIDKLNLIFNLRLYKTLNENKKTGVKYVVMRAYWIDANGKNVRWFSRNLGAESKVLVNDKIPINRIEAIENEMLLLMWDQYYFDYLGGDDVCGIDRDGNIVMIDI